MLQPSMIVVERLSRDIPLRARQKFNTHRNMGRLQEIATLPLDLADDATPVEAAMWADGDKPGLARHEGGSFSHQ